MTYPDRAGILNEGDLIEECVSAMIAADSGPVGSSLYQIHHDEFADGYKDSLMVALSVLRRRHLLTDQGIEQVKASEAKRLQSQSEGA